jgi:hypothetical protein
VLLLKIILTQYLFILRKTKGPTFILMKLSKKTRLKV